MLVNREKDEKKKRKKRKRKKKKRSKLYSFVRGTPPWKISQKPGYNMEMIH